MNILDIAEKHKLKPWLASRTNSKGREYHCHCPECGGETKKSDRMILHPDEGEFGTFWCRGTCGGKGDAITFLMKYEGLSFKDAAVQVGKTLEAPMPGRTPAMHRRADEFTPNVPTTPQDIWQARAQAFVDECHANLLDSDQVLLWLSEKRGINVETVRRFRLGLNPKKYYRSREAWGLPPEKWENGKPKLFYIAPSLIIPTIVDGRVVRIRRRSERDKPKYLWLQGSGTAQAVLGDQSAMVVVESDLDALLLAQEAGDLVSALALGSSTTKPDKNAFSKLRAAEYILIALDSDGPGQAAARWWAQEFPDSKYIKLSVGKDPTEAFLAGVDLRDWILQALPPIFHVREQHRMKKENLPPLDLVERKTKNWEGGNKKPGVPEGAPAELVELAGLLARHPVMVNKKDCGLLLQIPEKWERGNWDISERISRLVFGPCMAYLDGHPADIVTGGNFWQGWKG